MARTRSTEPLVVFDIGAVLLELHYHQFYEAAGRLSPREDFRKEFAALELRDLRGELSREQFLSGVRTLVGRRHAPSDEEITSLIEKSWGRQLDDVVKLKERVARDCAVGLLSNMGAFGYPLLHAKHPAIFETYGGPAIYSFEHGTVKPERAIYELFPKRYSPIILIDDKAPYLTGAEAIGWTGIHYVEHVDASEAVRSIAGHDAPGSHIVARSADELAKALEDLGIDTRT